MDIEDVLNFVQKKFQMLLLVLLLTNHVSESSGAIQSCYTDNYSWTLDNFCFEVVFQERHWYDARDYCAKRNGDLAEIRTKRIQDSIAQHLKANHNGRNGFWFGATDTDNEGHWLWLHRNRTMLYSNWNPSQGPNDHGFLIGGAFEDCAMVRTDDNCRWHDGPCDGVVDILKYGFLCQYPLIPTAAPKPASTVTSQTKITTTTSKPTTKSMTTLKPTKFEPSTHKPTTTVTPSTIRPTTADVTQPTFPSETHQTEPTYPEETTTEPIGVIIG